VGDSCQMVAIARETWVRARVEHLRLTTLGTNSLGEDSSAPVGLAGWFRLSPHDLWAPSCSSMSHREPPMTYHLTERGGGNMSQGSLIGGARALPRAILAPLDASVWLIAILAATGLRYMDASKEPPWRAALLLGLGMAALFLLVAWALRLYSGRHRIGSSDETLLLGMIVVFVACVGTLAIDLPWPTRTVAISIPLLSGALAGAGILVTRILMRLAVERSIRPSSGARAIVVGAGDAGYSLVRDLLTNPASPYLPVAFVDDSAQKKHYRVGPVAVEGRVRELPELVRRFRAERILIAAPSAKTALYRQVLDLTADSKVKVKSLPTLDALMSESIGFTDLRDLDMTDLLGRNQVSTDLTQIAGYLTNRRVLVTGAGGSIGSELVRQIHRLGPARLGMLDRDESALHQLQLSLDGRGQLNTRDLILADIRDSAALDEVMGDFQPEVVFHAAALKHLPMLEMYPDEGWKSNVLGTQNVINACASVDVGVFVNISTDKAADPSSVLGRSKRLAEQLTAYAAESHDGQYVSVRFGNVLGSRGSVLTAFAEQIRAGGPVTVTDPEVTRYFMTISESVQLVLQAGALGESGEVMVLEMGTPVKIQEMAAQVIQLSGKDIQIVHTGLRAGEKVHEVLASEHEQLAPTKHPLIGQVQVPAVDPASLLAKDARLVVRGATVRSSSTKMPQRHSETSDIDLGVKAAEPSLTLE
jgi:FlaA1/EpsC-like NDP-sugar epimerase